MRSGSLVLGPSNLMPPEAFLLLKCAKVVFSCGVAPEPTGELTFGFKRAGLLYRRRLKRGGKIGHLVDVI